MRSPHIALSVPRSAQVSGKREHLSDGTGSQHPALSGIATAYLSFCQMDCAGALSDPATHDKLMSLFRKILFRPEAADALQKHTSFKELANERVLQAFEHSAVSPDAAPVETITQ